MKRPATKALMAVLMAVTILAVALYARVDAFGGKDVHIAQADKALTSKGQPRPGEKKLSKASGDSNKAPDGSNKASVDVNKASDDVNKAEADSNQPLALLLRSKGIEGQIPNLKIVVDKSAHTLTLYSGVTPLKQYHVAIGEGGLADKQIAGDKKTPEGKFYIAETSVLSPVDQYLGSRWLRVSYPNIEDAERGLKSGIIDQATHDQIVDAINKGQIPPQRTALGGGVGIHGGTGQGENQGDYWTWGCMGLQNSDIEDFFNYITVGTELIITA